MREEWIPNIPISKRLRDPHSYESGQLDIGGCKDEWFDVSMDDEKAPLYME